MNNRKASLNGIDWLSPIPIFFFIVLLGVFMPISSFIRFEDAFSIFWPFIFYNKHSTVVTAIIIYMCAALLFYCGYSFAKKRSRIGKNRYIDVRVFQRSTIVVLAVGIFSFSLITYSLGGLQQILQGASDRTRAFAGLQGLFLLLNVFVSLSIVWYIKLLNNKSGIFEKSIFLIYVLLSIVLIAFQGQKSTIFVYIASIAVIYNCRVKKISSIFLFFGIVATFLILMAYHVYKQEYLVLGRVASVSSGSQFWQSAYDFLNQQLFGNFMQLQTLSVLIEGMPIPLEYQYGYTYLSGLLMLVPRQIFPDKPLPSTGIFTEAFWPAAWNEGGTTLPPGLFGEAYMNFGVIGVLIAGLLAGLVMGRFHGRFLRDPSNDLALIYYAVMVASILHFFRGELASVTYLLLSIAVPCHLFMTKPHSQSRF